MTQQIVVIHGGTTFKTKQECLDYLGTKPVDKETFQNTPGWKDCLAKNLGQDFEVFNPTMPNRVNADFVEWGVWFDRLIPFLEDNVILIGHSMGGIFLAKYLSENNFPKIIKATILIAPPFKAEDMPEALTNFAITQPLDNFAKQAGKIYLFHSQDDPVVPFSQSEKYQQALPQAKLIKFSDREHFNQPELPELQELIIILK